MEQNIQDVLRKYLAPDCLKVEYDGMTTYELARKIIEAITISDNHIIAGVDFSDDIDRLNGLSSNKN